MAKFRKKPVTIDAIQFNGEINELITFVNSFGSDGQNTILERNTENQKKTVVTTLEGDLEIKPQAWLIRGVKGEFYACDNEIFLMTYDKEDSM